MVFFQYKDYIRALVPDSPGTHVLMTIDEDGLWDLPYFVFDLSHPDNYIECATELQKQLQIDAHQPCFTVRTELLGRYHVSYRRKCRTEEVWALSRLVCMETHIDHIDLPASWGWKDVDFVMSLKAPEEYDEAFQAAMTRTAQFLNRDPPLMKQLSQPRHQPGWYREAASWLKQVVEEQGAEVTGVVSQIRAYYWATILCVTSTRSQFFLKSPALSTETTTTLAIQELMPERTLEVVGVSERLKSFVSKEFELVYGRKEDEHTIRLAMVEELASMQLASIQHREALLAAGCPLLGTDELLLELDDWLADEKLREIMPGRMEEIQDVLPQAKKYLRQLQDCKIPLTLTHGDFSMRNVGFIKEDNGEERMIMFDWQNAAISHPFYDFYDFAFEVTEEERDAYLQQWTIFEPLEQCRELYEIARTVGWLLRARGNVSCFRTANPVSSSETALEISEALSIFAARIKRIPGWIDALRAEKRGDLS